MGIGNIVLIGSIVSFSHVSSSLPPPRLSSLLKESEAEAERKRRRAKNEKWDCWKPRSADERSASVRFRSLKSVNNSHVEDNEAISGYAPRPRSSFGRELGHFDIPRIFTCLLSTFVLRHGVCFTRDAWITPSIGLPSIFTRYFIIYPSLNRRGLEILRCFVVLVSLYVSCYLEREREFSGEF